MPQPYKIGFLGAGKMANALAKGFIKGGLTSASEVLASDPSSKAREQFEESVGAKTTDSNQAVIDFAKVLFLAVKPNLITEVLEEARDRIKTDRLIISIAAGVPLAKLEGNLKLGARVIRVMPNTPALVEQSATAIALGKNATDEDGQTAHELFSSVGLAFEVKEALMDAVTGLSGSGPAYCYLMMEALSDGGVAAGLPREIATQLAAQTLLGSAKMVLETGNHPGQLKDMVTSPGGTTIEGVHQLEQGSFRAAIMNAVRTSANKSRQLGQG